MRAVNLIPTDQRGSGGSAAAQSDGGAFIVLGLIAGLAVLALLYGVAHHQVSTRRGQATSLTAQAQAAQNQASVLAPYKNFVALRDARVSAVSELVNTRFDWAHAIHELGRVLPYDVALTTVTGTVGSTTTTTATTPATGTATGSGAVSSATPAGSVPSFTVVGCATSQSEVAETLDRLRLMDGVTGVELTSSEKSSASSNDTGSCPGNDPVFTAQVTYAPLPSAAAASGPSGSGSTASASSTGSTGATSSAGSSTSSVKGSS